MEKYKYQRGYIALMATIIISLVLLIMAIEEGSSGWYARFNILGTEAKEQASSLAEGCAEQAMAIMLTDPSYTGNATSTNSVGVCHVAPIQINYPITGLVTIKTQAVVNDSYANLNMAMTMNNIHLGAIPTTPTTGTLFITTHVINDSSGTKTASDFTMHVSANPMSDFAGSESGIAVTIQPGAYSITETSFPNYSVSNTGDCSGNIIAGEIKFCTITNDDITTTLTVIANVVNDNLGTNAPSDVPLFIDGVLVTLGSRVTVSAGAHTVSATTLSGYAVSPWGYDCSATGSVSIAQGQNKTCIINFNDIPPPAPSCADTVMILDRTGSMSSADRNNEKIAANSLVNLYSGVLPPATLPQLGVGSIGGLDGSPAQVPTLGQLSINYTNLLNTITSMMNTTSSVGSDLSAGITVASNELNSVRHIVSPPPPEVEKEKVIILVSDGDPNEPSGSAPFNTGFKSPSADVQNASGELWSTPSGAYALGGGDATDPVSENDRHRYYNFGFGTSGAGLPTGSNVTGIEAQFNAWATAGNVSSSTSVSRNPSVTIGTNQFTNPANAYTSDNSYAVNTTNGQSQSYGNFGFNIPVGATITGITITTESRINSGGSSTTGTLFPAVQGAYTAWTNGESTVDETGAPDCSSSDSILENNSSERESVVLDLSSIPNGSTITDVSISTYDRGDSNSGGTYKTFARINGSDNDASGNLTATGTSGCNLKTQIINLPDTVKSSGTNLEVGVVKVSGNNSTVRVGAIRAVVTYTPAVTGQLGVSLSSNNGSAWTVSKTVNLTSTESVTFPTGNGSSDLWNRTWTAGDFNNGNFAVKIQNNSTTGNIISLDQVTVTVYYNSLVSAPTSCQLGVDLSWNGTSGTPSWSNEKTQTLTSTSTTYTVGASSDDWSSSHTWTPTEFSNTNFRARVHAIDPGTSCDNTAIVHLDSLQLKVHYTQTTDPVVASLTSADTAKLSGVDIFTIHFGSDPSGYPGRELLANLASGNTTVSGHQNGSFADPGGLVSSDTGLKSTTAIATPNQFTNPNRAFSSDNSYATDNVNGHTQGYGNFGLTIPPTATINGITVEIEAKSTDSSGCQVGVELSSNNGTNFSSSGINAGVSGSDNTYTLGGNTNLWGRTWTPSDFSNGNFTVRLQNIDPGNSCTNGSTLSIDRVRARVYYTVNTENSDGDNFFIAPTSLDMKSIFDFIGNQVCPASLNLVATPPPTTGTLLIITQVTNNNGGANVAGDFTVNVSAVNPSQSTFAGSATGVSITVNPGSYNVSQNNISGYTTITGATCTSGGSLGDIVAGETRVCVLNTDDIPPPPPPPNLNLDPNSWHEVPN